MNEWIRKYGLKTVMGAGLLLLAGCQSNYSLVRVEGGRVPITAVYDEYPDKEAEKLVEHYKEKVDSIMSPVIGYATATLTAYRPESPLSNLIADVLRDGAKQLTGQPADVAVMNMGGIRNALPEGNITYGTIYEIAPFENALCVVTMDGATLETLFSQIASVHGEGISGAQLVITSDGKLEEAKVGGRKIEKDKEYTIATIDYLAEGNDKLEAFRDARSKQVSKKHLLRNLLLDYVAKCEKEGRVIQAETENRIIVR